MRTHYIVLAAAIAASVAVISGCGSSKSVTTATPAPRRTAVQTPCVGEAQDKPGEYMAGLGISSPSMNERDALLEANRVAVADITTRYIGVIKNGVESYQKDTTVPSGKKAAENKLEGIATAAGSKAINEYAARVCFQTMELTDAGTYVAYTAVHVAIAKVNQAIASALEVAKVDYDAEKFNKWLQTELDAQAKAQNTGK